MGLNLADGKNPRKSQKMLLGIECSILGTRSSKKAAEPLETAAHFGISHKTISV